MASSPIIAHNDGRLVSTSTPKVPSPSAMSTLAATITRCGGNLSAATPPMSANTSDGAIWAAST